MTAIVVNNDIIFPYRLTYGSRKMSGGRDTRVTTTASGKVFTQTRRVYGFARWDVSYGVKNYADLLEIETIFNAVGQQAEGFLFTDPLDFSSAINRDTAVSDTDQLLGTADGTDKTFQMYKVVTKGSKSYTKKIFKPKTGTVVLALDGVNKTTNWSVDVTTGIVTVLAALGSGTVTVGYEYYVPAMFDQTDISQVMSSYQHGELESIIVRELIGL